MLRNMVGSTFTLATGSRGLFLFRAALRLLAQGKTSREKSGELPPLAIQGKMACRIWRKTLIFVIALCESAAMENVSAQSPYESSTDFARYAIKLRENGSLAFAPGKLDAPGLKLFPRAAKSRNAVGSSSSAREVPNIGNGRSGWRLAIPTTVFWIGERPTTNNPVANDRSSWDPNWCLNYGGCDDPDPKTRKNFVPTGFFPRQNPFYAALPYNDVEAGRTKPEAREVIPWFKEAFVRDGESVLKGRWLAIRHQNKICYAQWEDCGPFCTDHWQYVFGNERPRSNINHGAGLDVSPAVRDYLGIGGIEGCDWRFVEFRDVPPGPWAMYGDNNDFVILRHQSNERFGERNLLLIAN